MSKLFSCSENISHEYCATLCRVGELIPIEGSDFLSKTVIAGFTMVVRKDEIKEGDIVIYCPIETVLNSEFLSTNNLYEISEAWHNDNHEEVEKLINEGKEEEAKKIVGFFNKHGRVRMIRLRGVESMGFIILPENLLKWKPKLKLNNIEEYLNQDFDTIDGDLFIKVYMPPVKVRPVSDGQGHHKRRDKKLKHFDKIIPGTFSFHYDTQQLNKNISKISPDDVINISEKMDGTSFIVANIPVKRKLSLIEKFYRLFHIKKVAMTEYGSVYSSRTVIKNKYINKDKGEGFYSVDIWSDINNKLFKYIPKGITVYGECIGYLTDTEKLIQKKGGHPYTYGCGVGKNKIIIYRMSTLNDDGTKYEWNVFEIEDWVNQTLKENPELNGYLVNINTFYHGKAKDLYPDLDISMHWNENFLEKLKNDKNFLMECDEPTCPKGTPAEGIVIRIDNDPMAEAFKLKCVRYMSAEAKDIDKGIVDQESLMNYGEDEDNKN